MSVAPASVSASSHGRMQLPEIVAAAARRSSAAGSGRSSRRRPPAWRPSGWRSPSCSCSGSTASGRRPPGPARGSSPSRRSGAPYLPFAMLPLGLAPPSSRPARAAPDAHAPPDGRPAARRHRAGAERPGAVAFPGALRGGRRAGGPTTPGARLLGRRAGPEAPPVGGARGRPGRGDDGAGRPLSGRRVERLGPRPRALEGTSRGTPSRPSTRCPTGSWSPHGEPFTVTTAIEPGSPWKPARGEVRLGEQRPDRGPACATAATRSRCPPQIEPAWLEPPDRRRPPARPRRADPASRADRDRGRRLAPRLPRPPAVAVRKDVRGGAVSLVKGSEARFVATASRELSAATVDGRSRPPSGATVASLPTAGRRPAHGGVPLAGPARPRRARSRSG